MTMIDHFPERPKSVQIGHLTWEIIYDDRTIAHKDGGYGETFEDYTLIVISSQCTVSTARAALWHEVLHTICAVFGPHRSDFLKLHLIEQVGKGSEAWASMPIEEMYVGFLELGILQFVKDNPHVWDWINGWLDDVRETADE